MKNYLKIILFVFLCIANLNSKGQSTTSGSNLWTLGCWLGWSNTGNPLLIAHQGFGNISYQLGTFNSGLLDQSLNDLNS